MQSEQLNELYAALAKAQAEFPQINKNRAAHYGYYTDAHALLSPLKPILNKYGLSVHEIPTTTQSGVEMMVVRLAHSSGQFVDASCTIKPRGDKDADWGACMSFRRRYLYRGILGVTIPEDVDDSDDGNEVVTPQELASLKGMLAGKTKMQDYILNYYKVDSFEDLNKQDYLKIITWIKKKQDAS